MKIGIIGAMDLEIRKLTEEEMTSSETVEKAGMVFHVGRLGNTDVVIVKSGVGKVNAAICAQILINCFEVTMDVTVFGYEPGVIPQMGTPKGLKNFPASPEMRAAAISACKEAVPGIGIYEGRIVSGDQFICTAEQKHRLVDTFHALCTEMEGAAIAHTAYLNKIPFVVLRAISDKADEEADVSYETFEHQAAENCARLVSRMVRSLGAAS